MVFTFDLSSLNNFDMSDATDAPTYRLLPAGEYDATVDAVELTLSKTSGSPMLVLDYTIQAGDGGSDVNLRDYVVLSFKTKNGPRRNPRFKQLAIAAGVKADNPAMTSADVKKAVTAILSKIPGRPVILNLDVQEGRPDGSGGNYPDRNQVSGFQFQAAEDPLAGLEL